MMTRVTQGQNPMIIVRGARGDCVGMYRQRDGKWQHRRGWEGHWVECSVPPLPATVIAEYHDRCRGL